MKRSRIASPSLVQLALGAVLVAVQPHPVMAQELEDEIELELGDEGNQAVDSKRAAEPAEAKAAVTPAPAPAKTVARPEPPQAVEEPALEEQSEIGEFSSDEGGSMAGSDAPNLAFEKRLYRIFQRSGRPLSDSKWSELIGARRAESYSVQAGDTLWDISQTFFGDGFFWSKLWAENGGIENPHKIEPGKHIRFLAGTEADAPTFKVTETAVLASADLARLSPADTSAVAPIYKEQVADAGEGEIDQDELIPKPQIPPAPARAPVLKTLPPSFVARKPLETAGYDKTGVDSGRGKAYLKPATVYLNSFILEKKPEGIGTLEEIELGEKVASVGQEVFLQLNRAVQPGDRFAVVFVKGDVKKPVGGKVGPVVEVGGLVEVTARVNDKKNQYRALVTYSMNPVRAGSVVLDEPLPRTTYTPSGTKSEVEVQVIGGEFDETRRFFGTSSVIYLDGGEQAGLREGDTLAVQAARGERREKSKFAEVRRPIAMIKVVKTTRNTATAVVLQALEEIRTGDRTGGEFPQPLRQIRSEAPETEPVAKAALPSEPDSIGADMENEAHASEEAEESSEDDLDLEDE